MIVDPADGVPVILDDALGYSDPDRLASMAQVPAATSVSVVPLTVHTLGVVEAKDTGKPEEAVATRGAVGLPSV